MAAKTLQIAAKERIEASMEYTAQTALTDDVQPGRALSIKRYFTTPGVHPFDTVEWETRDARIGHGDRIAFEQEDVEFPKSWSRSATTTSGIRRPPARTRSGRRGRCARRAPPIRRCRTDALPQS